MKKLLLLTLAGALSWSVQAQHPISFGPKVGWNMTSLSTDYTSYLPDLRSGGQLGGFFSLYINHFYIQPELYLSIKRGSLSVDQVDDPINSIGPVSVSQNITLKTVDFPLLLGYELIDLKLVKLRIWGGPVASYILDKDYTLTINGVPQSERITRSDFEDATWAVQVGAGLDLLMLTVDVGYEWGLADFMAIQTLDNFDLKNNLFYCSIGWRIY